MSIQNVERMWHRTLSSGLKPPRRRSSDNGQVLSITYLHPTIPLAKCNGSLLFGQRSVGCVRPKAPHLNPQEPTRFALLSKTPGPHRIMVSEEWIERVNVRIVWLRETLAEMAENGLGGVELLEISGERYVALPRAGRTGIMAPAGRGVPAAGIGRTTAREVLTPRCCGSLRSVRASIRPPRPRPSPRRAIPAKPVAGSALAPAARRSCSAIGPCGPSPPAAAESGPALASCSRSYSSSFPSPSPDGQLQNRSISGCVVARHEREHPVGSAPGPRRTVALRRARSLSSRPPDSWPSRPSAAAGRTGPCAGRRPRLGCGPHGPKPPPPPSGDGRSPRPPNPGTTTGNRAAPR